MKETPEVSENESRLTQHAMLVIWGLFAQRIGLIDAIKGVKLKQKVQTHTPQTKVLEFLVAILAGFAHLKDISRSAHPLDQDEVVAEAWGQPGWADYSGVSRTLSALTEAEASELVAAVDQISRPFIENEVSQALAANGELVIDGDLTGREVSDSSISFPDATFGHMGDTIELGYQAAMLSLHSPTYGRLWLASELHSGNTVSMNQTRRLVHTAEAALGVRPRRRTELLAGRLRRAEALRDTSLSDVTLSEAKVRAAEEALKQTQAELADWEATVVELSGRYQQQNRPRTPHDQLNRAQKKVNTCRQRVPRRQKGLQQALRRLTRHQLRAQQTAQHVAELQAHYQQLLADNAANPQPVRITIRLDAGFTSREHIAWLIEMGYDLYTRGRFPKVRRTLVDAITDQTDWIRVGAKAEMTTWANTTLDDYFVYPLDVALLRHPNTETNTFSSLLHYGHTNAAADPDRWFHAYNGRQTIEAGIKEGKNVFQMHHFKVRAPQALRLQEYFAVFAANFVRFAGVALDRQFPDLPFNSQSVKEVVQVAAHSSAQVERQAECWILTFTPQSYYAGIVLHFGGTVLQLPLPLLLDIHFLHF